jgi:hypothetical protein
LGPRAVSRQVRKIFSPPGFDPRTVRPVASRYTDYPTRLSTERGFHHNCLLLTFNEKSVETLQICLQSRENVGHMTSHVRLHSYYLWRHECAIQEFMCNSLTFLCCWVLTVAQQFLQNALLLSRRIVCIWLTLYITFIVIIINIIVIIIIIIIIISLCKVFILIFLTQTMSLGNTALQLFCCYYSWCLYR